MKKIVQDIFDSFLKLIENTVDSSVFRISNDATHWVTTLWAYFAIFAVGMTLIYFLIEINNRLVFERSDFTMKSFFAPFLKLVIAFIIIGCGKDIIAICINLGNGFVDEAGKASLFTADNATVTAKLTDYIGDKLDLSFFAALAFLFPMLICFVVAAICVIVWLYKAVMWKIELLFRICVTPIALADVYSGKNSNTIRWCKSFLACCLTGGMYILMPKVAVIVGFNAIGDFYTANFASLGSGLWATLCMVLLLLAIPIAALGAAGAAKTAIKEALS